MSKIRLNINGLEVCGYEGQTILEVARENGVDIPTLCHDDRVAPYGACGLCVVELEGSPKLARACATVISPNMVIKTNTDRVKESRKLVLELLLSDHKGDCRPPCALACPAGTDCQGYVGLVANGEYKEAVKLIKDLYPLPASIGRVCPHPCETACRRQLVEEPISIAFIKSFIGDRDLASEQPYIPECEPSSGHTVAVVGGGPAGLTAAYQLKRKGHEVTIYDAMPKMGGMLRYGIPEYRLPKEILDKEIALIEKMGVKMLNGVKLGRDITFAHLRSSYDAVLVATGAWTSIKMGVAGEDNPNVHGGIDFLRKAAMGEPVRIGDAVAIVGGGNTAMDACRSAVRLGAKKVYCIYRRTEAEMPAEDIEIKEAKEEGVEFKFLTNPVEIVSKEDGSLSHVRLQKMKLGEPDASGRRSPVPIEGEEEVLEISSLIMALGQKLDPEGLDGVELTRRGTVSADEVTFRTNLDNVFAAGDATNKGAGIAIAAIGEAEKAARVMDSYLKGQLIPYKKPYLVERDDLTEADFKDRERVPRKKMRHLSPEERRDNFHEVNRGFSEEEAICESKRCLECGCHDYFECKLVDYANQYEVAPQKYDGESHQRTIDNSHPFIDRNPDKCILCGRCVRVCADVMGRTALGLVDRGFDSMVKPALDMPLKDTDCISCGQCINLCPTGALGEKTTYNKRIPLSTKGTDSVCAFCSMGCKVNIQTKGSLITKSLPDNKNNGLLCVKGRFGHEELVKNSRLRMPRIRKNGELVEVSWEEANIFISKKLQSIGVRYGADAVGLSVSDRMTNEDIYMIRKYGSEILGTKNIFSFGAKESGLKQVIGCDCSTNKAEELLSTNLIVLVGTDLMKEHAVLGVKVLEAVKNGCKVILISDCKDTTESLEWANIQVCPENSTKFIKDVVRSLGGEEVGGDALQIAKLYKEAKKAMIIFDQNKVSVEGAKAIAQMAVAGGHIGRPRDGIIQLKPNVNSQGLSDLNIGCGDGKGLKGLIVFGEDVKDFDRSSLEFLAVADMYMTETAAKADAVLPLISLVESSGTVTNCTGEVQEVKAAIPALGKPNWKVAADLANAMTNRFDYSNEKEIQREMKEQCQMGCTGVLCQNGFKTEDKKAVLTDIEDTELFEVKTNSNVVMNRFEKRIQEIV